MWQRSRTINIIYLFLLLPMLAVGAYVQTLDSEQNRNANSPIAIDSLCVIQDDANTLSAFLRKLKRLEERRDTVLTIVHLGDSHVQAGFYDRQIMQLLHQRYGNAGRGWISPLKLAQLNEPNDYVINSSANNWVSGRIIQRTKRTPIGPGGIGIQANATDIKFDVQITPANRAGYAFNQMIMYRGDKSMPMVPTGGQKDGIRVSYGTQEIGPQMVADTFFMPSLSDAILLQSTQSRPGTTTTLPASAFSNSYYGFSLTNGKAGILYHALGVNGAKYVDYADADYMSRLAVLKPSLLVVSLGTNEAFGGQFREDVFSRQVRSFLSYAKRYLPETAIILITPADCLKSAVVNGKRTYVRNEDIQRAADVITKIAREDGLACWDLFSATGGANSSEVWTNARLLSRDGIHYTMDGYRELGRLFYTAFMRLTEK